MMLERDMSVYEAVATNKCGQIRCRVGTEDGPHRSTRYRRVLPRHQVVQGLAASRSQHQDQGMMLGCDEVWYEALAISERSQVCLELSKYARLLYWPEEAVELQRKTDRIEARVTGVPYPDIKWYKDWQPLAASIRIKVWY